MRYLIVASRLRFVPTCRRMKAVATAAVGLVALLTRVVLAQPVCPNTRATLTILVENRTGAAVDVDVDGELAPDSVPCGNPLRPDASYPLQRFSCEPGSHVCGTLKGQRPGAWCH